MKKGIKVLGILAAIAVVLMVGLVILVKVLVTPERVKSVVLPLVEAKLHRQVSLGPIEVSLFRGITLNDLKVKEAAGSDTFLAVDRVVLRYQLLPLLSRRVVVDEVGLEGPQLRIERLPDGQFNFSDLLPRPGEAAPAKVEPPAAGKGMDLVVSQVSVKRGALLFIDRAVSPGQPLELRLEQLELSAHDISLERAFPVALNGVLAAAPLEIDGTIDPAGKGGRARIKLTGLDVTHFAPYYREKLPGKLAALRLGVDIEAEGNSGSVVSSGRVDIGGLDLWLDALKDAPLRGDLVLEHKVRIDLQKKMAAIDELKLGYGDLVVQVAGKVEQYAAAPLLDLAVTVPTLELRKLVASLPAAMAEKARPFDPAGSLSIKARLAGPAAEPKKLLREGEVQLSAVQVNAAGMRPEVSGALLLKGDSVNSRKLTVSAGSNRADVDLRGGNLFGRPVALVLRLTADRFDLDPLLGGSAPDAGSPGNKPQTKGGPQEIGPFDLPLRADTTVQIGQTVYKGLSIDHFDLHALLDGNVLNVDRLTGNVARGSFRQTARIDLRQKGLTYATRLNLRGIQAEPLIAAFAPKASGTVFGALDLDADLSGTGTLPDAARQNLSGQGTFEITGGKVAGPGFVQEMATFVNLAELREIRFDMAKGSFSISRGKVLLNGDFAGNDVRLAPAGTVGLDSSLDLALDLRLSPALTSRLDRGGRVAQFFTDSQGWGQVPLKVTGTAGKPRFVFDATVVRGKVQEKVKEEIQKKLQEKVFDKLAPKQGEGETDGTKSPSRQLLDDTIKGLLGR